MAAIYRSRQTLWYRYIQTQTTHSYVHTHTLSFTRRDRQTYTSRLISFHNVVFHRSVVINSYNCVEHNDLLALNSEDDLSFTNIHTIEHTNGSRHWLIRCQHLRHKLQMLRFPNRAHSSVSGWKSQPQAHNSFPQCCFCADFQYYRICVTKLLFLFFFF